MVPMASLPGRVPVSSDPCVIRRVNVVRCVATPVFANERPSWQNSREEKKSARVFGNKFPRKQRNVVPHSRPVFAHRISRLVTVSSSPRPVYSQHLLHCPLKGPNAFSKIRFLAPGQQSIFKGIGTGWQSKEGGRLFAKPANKIQRFGVKSCCSVGATTASARVLFSPALATLQKENKFSKALANLNKLLNERYSRSFRR